MVPEPIEATVVSFVAPVESCHSRLTASCPHVPLVRLAKKRKVGLAMLTQTGGEIATPVGWIASDFESRAPCT